MRLEKISLHNWQSYYGHGAKATTIRLFGKNDLKNVIVYGQNTRGKTALWEAVRFALYGRVPRRMTGGGERSFKPVFAPDSTREPLLNIAASREGHATVRVELWFDSRGTKYHLDRTYQLRQGVKDPRSDSDFEMRVVLRNESEAKFEQDPDTFIQNHLPEDLVRFFMFDGERLEEYRGLLQDKNDVELRSYIESILRLPVLTHGANDFADNIRRLQKQIRKFDRDLSSDQNQLRTMEVLEIEIEGLDAVIKSDQAQKDVLDSELAEVTQWLQANDQGKVALAQEETFKKEEVRLEHELQGVERSVRDSMPDLWRTILTPQIDASVERVEREIARQKAEQEKRFQLREEADRLDRELQGEVCWECGRPRAAVDQARADEIHARRAAIDRDVEALARSSVNPDPHELESRLRSLLKMRREQSLQPLLDSEKAILSKRKALREVTEKRKKAEEQLSAEMRREVARRLQDRDGVVARIGVINEQMIGTSEKLKERRDSLHQQSAGLKTEGIKSLAHQKADRAVSILQGLEEVWADSLATYRETMRSKVEALASASFMACSNNADNYSGLSISPEFTITILDRAGNPDLGSPGQWAIIAYAMLEALTDCSGIEFPMIIDTPGRSIDNEHLANVFARFLDHGRQVVFLPEGSELDPVDGDARYGHLCSATYSLAKNTDDQTTVNLRIDNLS